MPQYDEHRDEEARDGAKGRAIACARTYPCNLHPSELQQQNNKLITLGRAHATDYLTAAPSSTSVVTKNRKEAPAQHAPFARHHSATAA